MKYKSLFMLILCLSWAAAGCSDGTIIKGNIEENRMMNEVSSHDLNLQICSYKGNHCSAFTKVEDRRIAASILLLLRNSAWKQAKVSMSRLPDYKIQSARSVPNIPQEMTTYDIWISTDGDRLEAIIEGQSRYAMLSKKDCMELKQLLGTAVQPDASPENIKEPSTT